MAFDEKLADRVRDVFDGRSIRYEEKRMMGGLCFMVEGKEIGHYRFSAGVPIRRPN
jgi:hypothetical protein